MKKMLLILAAVSLFAACQKSDPQAPTQDGETRASALGFDSAEQYCDWVNEQHALGNHENCDVLADGTHTPCLDATHSGQCIDGEHHDGIGAGHGSGGGCHN